MDGPRLSLVLPAYNESAGIAAAVAEADEALSRLFGPFYEILVVDDGSADHTADCVRREMPDRPNVRLLVHPANRGYGAALRTGFEAARGELVAFTDADCQFHLDDLALLVPLTETHPVAVGYRVDRQDPWARKFLSKGYNLLARTLLGTTVRDIDCALKVFRREELQHLLPESPNFFVNTEMLSRAAQLGMPVAEAGVRHRPRVRGTSTVSLREVPRTLGRMLPFWWSRVMFAGGGVTTGEEKKSPSWVLPILCLTLLASLLFFSRLRAPLLEPQEVRYAEIPRQMLAADSYVVPVLDGRPYLDKPPLLYWSVIASYRLFGVYDTSARVVPALAGVLTVLIIYLWGRRLFGPSAAFCGAAMLCATPLFIYRARMLGFDSFLSLWVVLSLAAGHLALLDARFRRDLWTLSAVALGLGLLTKGPVAAVLVVVPLAAASLLDTRLFTARVRHWFAYAALSLVVAAPWFVAVSAYEPAFPAEFFLRHNLERFVTPFDHARPFYDYLPGLLLGLLPWTLLLPGLVWRVLDRRHESASTRPGGLGVVLLSSLWCVAFFSLAGCKRPSYLLPALPPLALALGWYLRVGAAELWERASNSATVAAWVTLLGAGGAVGVGVAVEVVRPEVGFNLGAAVLAGAALTVAMRRVRWAVTLPLTAVIMWLGVQHLLPAYNTFFSVRGQLRKTFAKADAARPIVCFPQRIESLSFYLPRQAVKVFNEGQRREMLAYLEEHPETVVLIRGDRVVEKLRAELSPGVHLKTREKRGAVIVGRVVRREAAGGREGLAMVWE